VFAYSPQALAQKRLALVIGNGAYTNATVLPNPTNDAADMTAALQGLGFTVIGGNDLDHASMGQKIGEFEDAAREADVTLLFYAGHGMQVNGRNYLVPVNAKLERESALQFEAIDAETILRSMAGPGKTAIALLDACRDNPLSRRFARSLGATRSNAVQQGLAVPAISGGGMLIGFATAPGDVAADGDGRNSPFTTALLKNMKTPGLEIQQLMTRVKADVFSTTKETQEPWHNSSLRNEIYLVPPSNAGGQVAVQTPDVKLVIPDPAPQPSTSSDEARLAWDAVKESKSISALDKVASLYADTVYGELAKDRATELRAQKPKSTVLESLMLKEDPAPAPKPKGVSVDAVNELLRKAQQRKLRLEQERKEEAARKQKLEKERERIAVLESLKLNLDPPPKPRSTGPKWGVIVGSFPKGQSGKARTRLQAARSNGLNAQIIDSNDFGRLTPGLIVVVIGAGSRGEALSLADEARGTFGDAYAKQLR
jgi:uncharacterized caspase-like protein